MEIFSDGFLKRIEKLIIRRIDKLIEDIIAHYQVKRMYLKKNEAQHYMHVGKDTLDKMIKEGLPVVQVVGGKRIDIRDIDKFMDERKVVECQELKETG